MYSLLLVQNAATFPRVPVPKGSFWYGPGPEQVVVEDDGEVKISGKNFKRRIRRN